MKLLLDENLSPTLVSRLADLFPGSVHVHDLGLGNCDDRTIWAYATENGFTVVSKDADFTDRSMRVAPAPAIVWIRLGNCSTHAVEMLLRTRHGDVRRFVQNGVEAFLTLGTPIKRKE